MVVYWRVLNIDGFWEYRINWLTKRLTLAIVDNFFAPDPMYLRMKSGQ